MKRTLGQKRQPAPDFLQTVKCASDFSAFKDGKRWGCAFISGWDLGFFFFCVKPVHHTHFLYVKTKVWIIVVHVSSCPRLTWVSAITRFRNLSSVCGWETGPWLPFLLYKSRGMHLRASGFLIQHQFICSNTPSAVHFSKIQHTVCEQLLCKMCQLP